MRKHAMNYHTHFNQYCCENDLDIYLSFTMPVGYESANGTFDPGSKTVYINKNRLHGRPDHEKLFCLFHELRHAAQYLQPNRFDELIIKSQRYIIMYDGVCHKLLDGKWKMCKLDGDEDFFINAYLGQPYETDANTFAYEKVRSLLGDSPELRHYIHSGCRNRQYQRKCLERYTKKSTKRYFITFPAGTCNQNPEAPYFPRPIRRSHIVYKKCQRSPLDSANFRSIMTHE